MYLEIMVGNSEEPILKSLNQSKLTIGSVESNDIVINSPSVSRKHLVVINESENFYVIDQGSTNGTFINEERLIPGRKVELTSFFPVRLGDDVLLTLLSENDDTGAFESSSPSLLNVPPSESSQSANESTRVISLKDLKKAKTVDLVVKREKISKRKVSSIPKKEVRIVDAEKRRGIGVKLFVFLMMAGVGYYQYITFEPEVIQPVSVIGKEIGTSNTNNVISKTNKLVSADDLISRERLVGLLSDMKCITEYEKIYCDLFQNLINSNPWGAVQTGTMVNVLIDGTALIDEAKKLYPKTENTPAEFSEKYELNLREIVSILFVHRFFPNGFNAGAVKDSDVTIGIFTKDKAGENILYVALAAHPESLLELKSIILEEHISNVKKIGPDAFKYASGLIRTY